MYVTEIWKQANPSILTQFLPTTILGVFCRAVENLGDHILDILHWPVGQLQNRKQNRKQTEQEADVLIEGKFFKTLCLHNEQ